MTGRGPLDVIARVMSSFRTKPIGEWEIALWFTSANEWLSRRRPFDRVLEAAESVGITIVT